MRTVWNVIDISQATSITLQVYFSFQYVQRVKHGVTRMHRRWAILAEGVDAGCPDFAVHNWQNSKTVVIIFRTLQKISGPISFLILFFFIIVWRFLSIVNISGVHHNSAHYFKPNFTCNISSTHSTGKTHVASVL